MRGPLYNCRIHDLEADDVVAVECPCGRTTLFQPLEFAKVWAKKGIPHHRRILDLRTKFRCGTCGSRGGATVRVTKRR